MYMQSLGNRELWPRFDACWSEVEEAKANLDFGILSVLQVTSIVWFDFSLATLPRIGFKLFAYDSLSHSLMRITTGQYSLLNVLLTMLGDQKCVPNTYPHWRATVLG
jgi:hypothetical protein